MDATVFHEPLGLILRPRRSQMIAPFITTGLLTAFCLAFAVGFLGVRDFGGALLFASGAVAIGLAQLLYVRNAQLFANADFVGKRNLFGMTIACARPQFDSVAPGRGTSPQLWFYRKDGRVAFKVQSILWAPDQIEALTAYVSNPPSGQRTS